MTAQMVVLTRQQKVDVFEFLNWEARLLDDLRLEEWLALFASDGHYWMPATWQQKSPLEELSLYYENLDLLTVRVKRIRHPRTETMRPAPRTAHLLANHSVEHYDGHLGLIETYATFSLVEYRLDEQRLFAGTCRHKLRAIQNKFHIVEKRVDLLNCDTERGHVRFNIPI